MTAVDVPLPAAERDSRIDGLTTVLKMFSRLVSPEGPWAAGSADDESLINDVLRVTAAAVTDADAVSITHVKDGKVMTVASSGVAAGMADALQYAHRQGPSLAAIAHSTVVVSGDLHGDPRWPELARAATASCPLRSACSLPLADVGMARASLNLYSERQHAWCDDTGAAGAPDGVSSAVVEATMLSLAALSYRHRTAHLNRALESNRAIGAAVGIIMAANRCTYDEAFSRLVQASQNSNRKLRTVADAVLATGRLDPDASHTGMTAPAAPGVPAPADGRATAESLPT